jgi:iron-sulfur cluster repair protein YtfE (RIC family)
MTAQSVVEDGEARFAAREHRDLTVGLAHIGETIERSRDLSSAELWARLHHTLGWLERELKPHLLWEDTWLYPQFDEFAGTPWATRQAHFEHRQIEALIAGLEADSTRWLGRSTPQTDADMVSHLSAIRAVIVAHMEREERFLMPLLEGRPTVTR